MPSSHTASQIDVMVEAFRRALAPAYVVWFDGRRLNDGETRAQIERGLRAALSTQTWERAMVSGETPGQAREVPT